jgi:hypothetical protein
MVVFYVQNAYKSWYNNHRNNLHNLLILPVVFLRLLQVVIAEVVEAAEIVVEMVQVQLLIQMVNQISYV